MGFVVINPPKIIFRGELEREHWKQTTPGGHGPRRGPLPQDPGGQCPYGLLYFNTRLYKWSFNLKCLCVSLSVFTLSLVTHPTDYFLCLFVVSCGFPRLLHVPNSMPLQPHTKEVSARRRLCPKETPSEGDPVREKLCPKETPSKGDCPKETSSKGDCPKETPSKEHSIRRRLLPNISAADDRALLMVEQPHRADFYTPPSTNQHARPAFCVNAHGLNLVCCWPSGSIYIPLVQSGIGRLGFIDASSQAHMTEPSALDFTLCCYVFFCMLILKMTLM